MVYKRLKVLDMAEADDFQGQSKSNKQPRVAESSFTVSRIEDSEEDMHKGDTSYLYADQLHRKESISNVRALNQGATSKV